MMKPIYIFMALLLSMLTFINKSYSHDKTPILKGSYLGQKPPGLIPKAFAPGIVTTEHFENSDFFTPDGKYLFFNRMIGPDNVDIFWVDAQFIETLRPKAPEVAAADVKLPFKDIPSLKKSFYDTRPADRKDAISVGELGVDGGNKDMVVKLAQEIADNKHDRFDSLLIAHKGKLLFESYYLRGRVNLPHPQASTTKAYLSLCIGRALQLGYLTMADLDKPLISFLKDLDSRKFVKGVEMITLHKAMTMRSGLRIGSDKMKELRENPSQLKGQNQIQAFFEHSKPITSQSQSFHYQSADPSMVMQVLDVVVPGSAKDFIKNELLDKMSINIYRWQDGISGLPSGAYGSSMTSRDMIKWGTLVINKGKWKGEQLIPEAFITKATSKITQPDDDKIVTTEEIIDTSYGYYWWLDDMKVGKESYLSKSAQGGGGQYIIVVEELDLLIVVTAHNKIFHDKTLSLMAKRILPAFIQ